MRLTLNINIIPLSIWVTSRAMWAQVLSFNEDNWLFYVGWFSEDNTFECEFLYHKLIVKLYNRWRKTHDS